jgi:hypothetical protein
MAIANYHKALKGDILEFLWLCHLIDGEGRQNYTRRYIECQIPRNSSRWENPPSSIIGHHDKRAAGDFNAEQIVRWQVRWKSRKQEIPLARLQSERFGKPTVRAIKEGCKQRVWNPTDPAKLEDPRDARYLFTLTACPQQLDWEVEEKCMPGTSRPKCRPGSTTIPPRE